MGVPDIALKKYFEDKERLADIFNYYCFAGKNEIQAEELETKSPIENFLITENRKKQYPIERIRDVLAAAQREGTVFFLLGIENQTFVDYGMPVRDMLYNALSYVNQISAAAKKKKRQAETDDGKIIPDEFLSGLENGELLTPVVNLILYYGKDSWNGPKNLAEMLDMRRVPAELHPYIQNNYSINLLEVRRIRDYEKFRTDIKEVFQLLSCESSKDEMRQLIERNERYHQLPRDAVEVIAALTASDKIMNYINHSKEEVVDMCKAIEDMILEGKEEGIQLGIQQGIQIFILDNLEENVPKGRIQQKLQRRFELTAEAASQYIRQYATKE